MLESGWEGFELQPAVLTPKGWACVTGRRVQLSQAHQQLPAKELVEGGLHASLLGCAFIAPLVLQQHLSAGRQVLILDGLPLPAPRAARSGTAHATIWLSIPPVAMCL